MHRIHSRNHPADDVPDLIVKFFPRILQSRDNTYAFKVRVFGAKAVQIDICRRVLVFLVDEQEDRGAICKTPDIPNPIPGLPHRVLLIFSF